jgi:hypothetical protein
VVHEAFVSVWAITIKGKISDPDYLRDLAFAASRKCAPSDRWDYWEENRAEGLTFCFQWDYAALIFALNCTLLGIEFECDRPQNSN